MTVKATGLRAVPVPTSVPTGTMTASIVDRPMIGARTTFTTGIWYSTTRTCGTNVPISGICVSAVVNAVDWATRTSNCSGVPFCTDEKSGRKLKSPVVGSSRTFPPELGCPTTV